MGTVLLTACEQKTPVVKYDMCLTGVPPPVSLEGGTAIIGSDRAYPEEQTVRQIELVPFEIDATEVTNAQFAKFVKATGYVTDAEKEQPGFSAAGAAVFVMPSATSPNWWQFIEGANWRVPEGPGSSIKGRNFDPVVQVSYKDAQAYAKWAGRRLPREAEWEYAAKAGATTLYAWGEDLSPDGKEMANTWQGAFPIRNTNADGFAFRAPVGCFPANGNGLYDMIGNVWEWTSSSYQASTGEPIQVIKGGSFLCAKNYCRRYRPSARQPQEAGLPTNHIGFRTVGDLR